MNKKQTKKWIYISLHCRQLKLKYILRGDLINEQWIDSLVLWEILPTHELDQPAVLLIT